MNSKTLIMALGFSGLLGARVVPELPENMHRWLLKMHKAQIELLKIDWGQPGFCTEWDQIYSSKTRSCGEHGKIVQRKIPPSK